MVLAQSVPEDGFLARYEFVNAAPLGQYVVFEAGLCSLVLVDGCKW